jgi:hypothetical protein
MDVELLKSLTKYPFNFNDEFYDSIELKQNKTCAVKCEKKDCLDLLLSNDDLTEYTCSKGYNNLLIIMDKFKFIINGLIYEDNTTVPKGRKEVRTDWVVDRQAISLFISKLRSIEDYLNEKINQGIEENFSMFHDFKTSMSIFYNCTQDIINGLAGNSFEEKLKNSNNSYQNLYNSLDLITSQLGMIDVIINPRSIEFGNKRTINLYRLFEKIKILFGHIATKKRDVSINLTAEGWIKDCHCYESIEFLPLILLDNALKYSVPDSDVEIKLEQHHGTVKVIVKNIGPVVKDENKEKIFQKFFRDEAGATFAREGIGMGLWIAQQILQAHQSKLCYYKNAYETRSVGLNVFSFDLRTID